MTTLVRETVLGCIVLLWKKNGRSKCLPHCGFFEFYGRRETNDHLETKKKCD